MAGFFLLIATLFICALNKLYNTAEIGWRRKSYMDSIPFIDNISQFQGWCDNIAGLLQKAHKDGVGYEEEIDINYCLKYMDTINERYCQGHDYINFCMPKSFDVKDNAFKIDRTGCKVCQSHTGKSYYNPWWISFAGPPIDGKTNKERIIQQLKIFNSYQFQYPSQIFRLEDIPCDESGCKI